MARVECVVEYTEILHKGVSVPGVVVTCGACGHAVESFGEGERSVKRCLALLREECPENEDNYYVEE